MHRQSFKRFAVKSVLATTNYMLGAWAAEQAVIQTTDVNPEESALPEVASIAGGSVAWFALTPYTDKLVDSVADKRAERKIEQAAAESALVN